MQIWNGKKKATKGLKKWIWEGLGLHLGRVWAALGGLLDTFGCFLAVFLVFQFIILSIINLKWGPRGLLDRFWEGLGRIWMRFGRIWAFKIKAFASHGHFLNTLGVPCCLTLCYKNPRAASLRLAERHN